MGKKYRVVVNGEAFEVEVEEIGGSMPVVRSVSGPAGGSAGDNIPPAAPPEPVKPAPQAAAQPAPAPKAALSAGGNGGAVPVVSPLPGKVLMIKVTEGQAVKQGDLLLMIEAMKMENEIFAAAAGVVQNIHASVGQNVETGQRLMDIAVGG